MLHVVFIVSFMIMSGLIVFSSKREHLLSMLLSLEYVMLSLYFMFYLVIQSNDIYFSLIFIVFTACEGALGLSILIIMSRSHGSDYFKSFNLVAW